jgi:cytochrome c-type biogenesis protein CcmH
VSRRPLTRPAAALLAACASLALAFAAPAAASEPHPTLAELEGEIMCPVCHTTLDQSSSLAARRIEGYIAGRIRAGDTKSEIEAKLVAQFGPAILAAPPRRGFDLIVWWLPIVGIVGAGVLIALAAWRWRRAGATDPGTGEELRLDPESEKRLAEELARFD